MGYTMEIEVHKRRITALEDEVSRLKRELETSRAINRQLKEENDKLKGIEPDAILNNPGISDRNRKTRRQTTVLTETQI